MHASSQYSIQHSSQQLIQQSNEELIYGDLICHTAESEINNTDAFDMDDSLFSDMNEELGYGANTSAKNSKKQNDRQNDSRGLEKSIKSMQDQNQQQDQAQSHNPSQTNQQISYKFEDALSELEKIAQQLESGKLSLEDALKLYKHGVKLKGFCEKELKKAKEFVESFEEGSI